MVLNMLAKPRRLSDMKLSNRLIMAPSPNRLIYQTAMQKYVHDARKTMAPQRYCFFQRNR